MGIILGKSISKIYGTKVKYTAVDNINIEIEAGDFICIMGPSGSGKTTCLNLLSTVDSPTVGQVYIKEKRVKGMSNKALSNFRYNNIGYIFQEFNLINNFTVEINIGIPLLLGGVKKKQRKERINEISNLLDIEELLQKKPMECSGGQRQRIAVARALVTKPSFIVGDEPTANLDTVHAHEMLNSFKKLNEIEKTTILLVTHDNMIASYGKKVVIIKDGKVENIIERGIKTQKEFFYDIVSANSSHTINFFE